METDGSFGGNVTDVAKFSIRDLSYRYDGDVALKDVSFDIPANQITVLFGPSHAGKSTLLRCLNRLNDLIEAEETEMQGQILLDGQDVYAPGVDVTDLRRRVGMVFPDTYPRYPRTLIPALCESSPRNVTIGCSPLRRNRVCLFSGTFQDRRTAFTSVSRSSTPFSTRCRAIIPVIGLLIEPAWKMVSGVTSLSVPASISPKPFVQTSSSFFTNAILSPGTL